MDYLNYNSCEKNDPYQDNMIDIAVNYAKQGFAVFPLKNRGKEPATQHGLKDASSDPVKVRELFSKYPHSNIGMACGKPSGGIVVVDVDVDDVKGIDGLESIKKWEHDHGSLPDTAMTLTGRGGNHYLYHTSENTRSRVGCLEGVDIRADGTYIVLPPSIHPNGNRYDWEYEISDYGIQEANASVLDLMNHGIEPDKLFKLPDKVTEGERNSIIYKLACSMQARGNSNEAIMAAAKAENESRCSPPLDDKELTKSVNSALTKPKGSCETDTTRSQKPIKQLLTTASQVEPEETKFLWFPYLIDHNVNALGGKAGTGKTFFICALMAAVSKKAPPEMPGIVKKHGKVLYFGGEDGDGVIVERLTRLDANLDNIILCESAFDVSQREFEEIVKETQPALIVFDPLMSYMKQGTNVNDPLEARLTTDYLRDIARHQKTCIVNVIHPPKKEYSDLLDRFIGSGGYVAGSRTATYLGYHPTDATKRVAIQPKNNAIDTNAFVFEIDPDVGFMWHGEDETITAKMVSDANRVSGSKTGQLKMYVNVVLEVMRINPSGIHMTAKEILQEYSKIHSHDINVKSFGQAINRDVFAMAMADNNYIFSKGSRTGNRQQYNCYDKSLLEEVH